jgi:hypothetical protein
MNGRAFLAVAQRLAQGSDEADWRTAGRAYYALVQEAASTLNRWGVVILKHQPFHAFVRLRYVYAADADLVKVSRTLDDLSKLRVLADYQLGKLGKFATAREAQLAAQEAGLAIALLDAIDADPTRQAAASADIRKNLPP